MRLAGTQRGGLADGAANYCAAPFGIGYREAERTSRYASVRSVTSIWRRAARGGDVYRSRPTKTADGIMRLAGAQRGGLADVAANYCAAPFGIGYREAERTSRYVGVCSVTSIWRCATRGGDVHRSRPTKTADRVMSLAGAQRWGLADVAADFSHAAFGIGYREAERTSRYVGVRSVTIIWRSATRSGDVYRSRPSKTADGIMRLAGTQRWGLADGAGHMSYAAIVIGHGEVERTSRYVGVRSVTII